MSPAQAAHNESHRKRTARQLALASVILGPASLPVAVLLFPGAAAVICGLVVRSISESDSERRYRIMALVGSTFGALSFMIGLLFWLGLI